jgi:hypothetical protein
MGIKCFFCLSHKYLVSLEENWDLLTNFSKIRNAESHENQFSCSENFARRQKDVGKVNGAFFSLILHTAEIKVARILWG